MNTIVPRHDVSHPAYPDKVKKYPEHRAKQISKIEVNARSVDGAISTLYLRAKISLAVDPRAAKLETWEAWAAAMQVAEALFALTTAQEGTTVERMIDHKVRTMTATGPRYCTNAGNWLHALFLAIICRDRKRWEGLCHIPADLLRQAGESDGASYNPYIYHWVQALQAYFLNRPGLAHHLDAALELSAPARVRFGDAETLNKLVFPQMNTFLYFVQRDTGEFNRALAQGLQLFRSYHTANQERAAGIDGAVPLGMLALACLAEDAGYHDPRFGLEVESGYLPEHILKRSWYGEFPI